MALLQIPDLRARLAAAGYDLPSLAAESGLSLAEVDWLDAGEALQLDLQVARKVARVLGCPLPKLLALGVEAPPVELRRPPVVRVGWTTSAVAWQAFVDALDREPGREQHRAVVREALSGQWMPEGLAPTDLQRLAREWMLFASEDHFCPRYPSSLVSHVATRGSALGGAWARRIVQARAEERAAEEEARRIERDRNPRPGTHSPREMARLLAAQKARVA